MFFETTPDRYIAEIADRAEVCVSARWPDLVVRNRVLLLGIRESHPESVAGTRGAVRPGERISAGKGFLRPTGWPIQTWPWDTARGTGRHSACGHA